MIFSKLTSLTIWYSGMEGAFLLTKPLNHEIKLTIDSTGAVVLI